MNHHRSDLGLFVKRSGWLKKVTAVIFSFSLFGCMNLTSDAQTVKLYPKTIRIQKGKTKTITAAAYSSSNQPNVNATFSFTNSNPSVVGLSNVLINDNDLHIPGSPPPNLRSLSGNTAGTATLVATWNGRTSNTATIIVDDPAATPTAIIHGDNDAVGGTVINTRVGEPIEVDAETSRGVNQVSWEWGDGDKTTELLSATHAYLTPGAYTMRLRVTNTTGQVATSVVIVNVSAHPPPTRIINVSTIQALLNAYNSATGGEHIVIPAGTVLSGEIVLPARTFSDYVTIRSSAAMPDIRDRVSPTNAGLVTFRGTYQNAVPLTIKRGASKIRLSGIKFDPKNIANSEGASTYILVDIGEAGTQSLESHNPTKIIMEHCVVNPPNNVDVVHAVLNDGYKVSIISSWLGNIKTLGGQDCQAIFSVDGKGAHSYHNNFLEASAENIMYGGAVPNIDGVVGTNIEIRRSYFSKRLSWRSYSGGEHPVNAKNLFEIKNARRVYLESSVLENHWDAMRSQLYAFAIKSSTSADGFVPWAIAEDIIIENNIVSHVYGGVATGVDVYGLEPFLGLKVSNVVVKNVLFDDLSSRWGTPGGDNDARFLQPNNVEDFRIDHVTVIDKDRTAGTALFFVSNNNFRIQVTNSIYGLRGEGMFGSGVGSGIRALNPGTNGTTNDCNRASTATWTITNNVMPFYGGDTSCYPTLAAYRNSYPNNYTNVGFADLNGGNYSLAPTSAYKNTASDGADPGVNWVLLNQRTSCSVSGFSVNCLTPASGQVVSVTGQVRNTLSQGVGGALVRLTNLSGETRYAKSNPFGYYRFFMVPSGQYTFSVAAKNHTFSSIVSTILQDTNSMDLVVGN